MLNLSPLYGIIIDGNKILVFVSKQKRKGKGKWLDISLFTGFRMLVYVGKYMWKFYAVYDTL